MKYKVTIEMGETVGEFYDPSFPPKHTFEITAKTKLAIKLKVNQYQEKHGIDEEDVVNVYWEPIGIPDDNEVVL